MNKLFSQNPTAESQNSDQSIKKPMIPWAILILVVLAVIGSFVYIQGRTNPNQSNKIANKNIFQNNTTEKNSSANISKNKEFSPTKVLVTTDSEIALYDILAQKIIASTTEPNAFSNVAGSSAAIQYNDKTGDIFYFIAGGVDYDGTCDPGGTCTNGLYKTNIYTHKTSFLWRTADWPPSQWVIDTNNNSVLVGFGLGSNLESTSTVRSILDIMKIDAENGATSTIFSQTFPGNTGFGSFALSNDGTKLYMTAIQDFFNPRSPTELSANYLDLTSNKLYGLAKITASSLNDILDMSASYYSYDDKYLLYFNNSINPIILDINNLKNIPINGIPYADLLNASFVWATDNAGLYYSNDTVISGDKQMRYYSLATQSSSTLAFLPPYQTEPIAALDKYLFYTAYVSAKTNGTHYNEWETKGYDLANNRDLDLSNFPMSTDPPGITFVND